MKVKLCVMAASLGVALLAVNGVYAAPGAKAQARLIDVSSMQVGATGARERAVEVLSQLAGQIGVAENDFSFKHARSDAAGNSHVRFNQTYQGLPVEFASLTVHFNAAGQPTTVTGYSVGNIDIDTGAGRVNARQLISTATIHAATLRKASVNSLQVKGVERVVFNTGALKGQQGSSVLAFKVNVVGDDPAVDENVYVDANTGAVLASLTQIHEAKNRTVYDVNNARNLNRATLARVEGQAATGDLDVDNAYDFTGDTYDFYFRAYNRDSIDGNGMTMRSYTHYKTGYQNAYWSGSYMVYGDGFTVDDVTGHEMTHGVTQYTSGLVYSYQSGALNESMSDIFGEVIDQINGKGNDVASVTWLMGEDIPSIGAIRSMANPPTYGDPDKVTSSLYYCGTSDNGGVHTNSGVPNKLFYLMTAGGAFNGYTVAPVGMTKAAAIHYHNLDFYLSANSQFADHRAGLTQSCNDLIGAPLKDMLTGAVSSEVISAADCSAIQVAMNAVELDTPACQ